MPTTTKPYDPGDPQPYEPYQAPDLAATTPPPQTQPSQSGPQPGPRYGFGKGAQGALGTAAFMATNILRGYAQGKEAARAKQAMTIKRTTDGLHAAYDMAAKQYYSMYQDRLNKGMKPEDIEKDPEMQQAKGAVDASWASMMKFIGAQVAGPDGEKKDKKGKRKAMDEKAPDGSDPNNPMVGLTSNDPVAKAKAWLAIATKIGPDVYQQTKQLGSPKSMADAKYGTQHSQNESRLEETKTKLADLQQQDTSKMSPEEKQKHEEQIQQAKDAIAALSGTPDKSHYGTYDIPGDSLVDAKGPDGLPIRDAFGNLPEKGKNYRREDVEGVTKYYPTAPKQAAVKAGTVEAFVTEAAKESGIEPKDLSAASQLGLQRAWAQSKQAGKTVGQNYVYTDKDTGDIVVVPLTRTTQPGKVEVPAVIAGGQPTEKSGTPGTLGTPTVPASTTGGDRRKATGTRVRDLPAPGEKPTTSLAPGAHVIGHTTSQPKAKSMQAVTDSYKKQKPLFDLLAAQEAYMSEVQTDHNKATPRQDLSLVVAAVRAMNPGSVRLPQQELELEIKAGSWGDRAARWFSVATTGLLPDDQRDDLFHIVQRETTQAGQALAKDWKEWMTNQPLPEDLKRFGGDSGGGGEKPKIPKNPYE